jgi:hypothetical protein
MRQKVPLHPHHPTCHLSIIPLLQFQDRIHPASWSSFVNQKIMKITNNKYSIRRIARRSGIKIDTSL